MKKLNTSFAIFIAIFASVLMSITNVSATTPIITPNTEESLVRFNKEFNEYSYIFKNVYHYAKENRIKRLSIYSGSTKLKTFTFSGTSTNVDDYFTPFFFYLRDSTKARINKVVISTTRNSVKVIDVRNNTIEYLNVASIKTYTQNHVEYMVSTNHVQHNQGDLTMRGRLDKFGIDFYGEFGENCSKAGSYYEVKTNRDRVFKIMKSYYTFRHRTEHWNAIVEKGVNKYFTYYVQKDDYLYSVTSFLNGGMN